MSVDGRLPNQPVATGTVTVYGVELYHGASLIWPSVTQLSITSFVTTHGPNNQSTIDTGSGALNLAGAAVTMTGGGYGLVRQTVGRSQLRRPFTLTLIGASTPQPFPFSSVTLSGSPILEVAPGGYRHSGVTAQYGVLSRGQSPTRHAYYGLLPVRRSLCGLDSSPRAEPVLRFILTHVKCYPRLVVVVEIRSRSQHRMTSNVRSIKIIPAQTSTIIITCNTQNFISAATAYFTVLALNQWVTGTDTFDTSTPPTVTGVDVRWCNLELRRKRFLSERWNFVD